LSKSKKRTALKVTFKYKVQSAIISNNLTYPIYDFVDINGHSSVPVTRTDFCPCELWPVNAG